MHYVIGCGGGGSWLVPKLVRLVKDITLIDGDILEEKNLDRQLFRPDRIGWNKARALADMYEIEWKERYFHSSLMRLERRDILFCCADNHACRKAVLEACDQYRCRAVIAGNEYTDYEAYWYETSFKDTSNDPRMFYPDILTDRSGDPLGPPGCVEEAKKTPQLVIVNAAAADMALSLWWFHTKVRPSLPSETRPHWPVMHRGNIYAVTTISLGERT